MTPFTKVDFLVLRRALPVRCDRGDPAPLTCIEIIHLSLFKNWHNAQFHSPPKRRKIWWELCRAAWYPAHCQRAHKTLKFFQFGGFVFHIGFTKDDDKIILQIFSFGNTKLIFVFFTKINFGHFILSVNKSYRHPVSISTVTLKVTVTRQIPL